jgi:membrane dipeptidase
MAPSSSHDDALVWDAHIGFYPSVRAELGRLERFHAAGIDYLSINVGFDATPWSETFKVLAETVDDIAAAKRAGKLALSFDLEGMEALAGDPGMLPLFHRLGVRQLLFAYNRSNAFGGGCHDEDRGLQPLGRRAIEEMNRVGILVDCSHTGARTTLEAMEVSSAPVVFSHSNPSAVWPHGRNISDEQIKACAATGGVVGITGVGIFLGDNDVRTETIVRHIDHVVELVGPEHVGIGLDSTCGESTDDLLTSDDSYWPAGNGYDTPNIRFAEPEQVPELATQLLSRGYSDADVRAILGGNFLRVARQVWR